MTTATEPAEAPSPRGFPSGFLEFLRGELASRPGRLADVLRIVALTVFVVVVSETFRVPLPAYSAYIVFFASKEETASTTLTGVVLILSASVAVLAALGVFTISAGDFGLRLPLMALVTFGGMFLSRVSPLGPAAFVIGFIMTVSLTLIDVTPPAGPIPADEYLTQLVLWLWVVVVLPVGSVVVANLLTGRDPDELFRRNLAVRLEAAGRLLLGETASPIRRRITDSIRTGTADILRYLHLSGLLHKPSPRQVAADRALVARTHEVMTLVDEWMALPVADPLQTAAAARCGGLLRSLAGALQRGGEVAPEDGAQGLRDFRWEEEGRAGLVLERLIHIVSVLPGLVAERGAAGAESVPKQAAPPAKRHLLAPDAFSNPQHVQFALKVTLSVVAAYIAYSLMAWPEIRTAMITCFFVTLGNFGETTHKMLLRLTGATIGGALGLGCVVWVMPYLTSITDLCLVIAAVAFLAAWISTSSERLSYAGMQIAMAFFFCVLVGYGPTVNLAMAKDRLVGILLGNVIVWLVFSNIWPVSAIDQARAALSAAVRTLAETFLLRDAATTERPGKADAAVFAFDNALARTWRLLSFNIFEPRRLKQESPLTDPRDADAVQALFGPALLIANEDPRLREWGDDGRRLAELAAAFRTALGEWLSRLAEQVRLGKASSPRQTPPDVARLTEAFERLGGPGGRLRAWADWYRELGARISRVDEMVAAKLHDPDDRLDGKGGSVA